MAKRRNGESGTAAIAATLLVLSSCFVAMRIAALAAAPLQVHNIEESYTGAISRELLIGPAFPRFDYQYEDYCGGTLVLGILGMPLFAVVGHRFLALKVLALAWSLATFLLWLHLFDRTLGRRAMIAAGVFWAFAPLAFLRLSLMAWGNHAESSLFTGLMLVLFITAGGPNGLRPPMPPAPPAPLPTRGRSRGFLAARAESGAPRLGPLALAGLVAGFSLYFCYTSAVGIAALLLSWLWLDRRFFLRRGMAAFLAGSAVGFLPWLAYNAPRGWGGIDVHGRGVYRHFLPASPAVVLAKGKMLLLVEFPRVLAPAAELNLLPGVGRPALALLVLVAAAAALGGLRRRPRVGCGSVTTAVLLVYPCLFAVVYALCDLGIFADAEGVVDVYAFRFFAPLLPFLAGIVAAGVAAAPRLLPLVALPVGLSLATAAATFSGIVPVPPRWTEYRGYSYAWLGMRMANQHRGLEETLARARRIADPGDRRFAVEGLMSVGLRRRLGGPYLPGAMPIAVIDRERGWIASLAPDLAAVGRRALAVEIRFRVLTGQLDPLAAEAAIATGGDDGGPSAGILGLCLAGGAGREQALARVHALEPDRRHAGIDALGLCTARTPREAAAEVVRDLAAGIAEADRPAFFHAYGFREGWQVGSAPVFPARSHDLVPRRYRRDFLAGLLDHVAELEAEDPILRADRLELAAAVLGAAAGDR